MEGRSHDARSGETLGLDGCVYLTEEQIDEMMLQLNNETTDSDVTHSRRKRTLTDFRDSSKWSLPITYKFDGAHCEYCTTESYLSSQSYYIYGIKFCSCLVLLFYCPFLQRGTPRLLSESNINFV